SAGAPRGVRALGDLGGAVVPVPLPSDRGVTLVGTYRTSNTKGVVAMGGQYVSEWPGSTGVYAVFLTWQDFQRWLLPPCGHLTDSLVPSRVALHVILDVSAGMSTPVGDTRLRDLAAEGVTAHILAPDWTLGMTAVMPPAYDTLGRTICE